MPGRKLWGIPQHVPKNASRSVGNVY
uniref:Uncharacterized protein n=1 Tax=Anguilla anguilla TaxID=7936 RepID=A0A0E9VFU3_ANGAN